MTQHSTTKQQTANSKQWTACSRRKTTNRSRQRLSRHQRAAFKVQNNNQTFNQRQRQRASRRCCDVCVSSHRCAKFLLRGIRWLVHGTPWRARVLCLCRKVELAGLV